MQDALLTEIFGNVLSTIIAFIAITATYLIFWLTYIRRIENRRKRSTIKVRTLYITGSVFLFLMARVWVEGFTQLLAVLGFVSAALVITNKETIMNFVGWLVISWRGLFAEDDLIQILEYKGYVRSFGILYFTINEVSETVDGHLTGRVVRIPNGIVSNHALVNFSQTGHLLEQHFSVLITRDSDYALAMTCLGDIAKEILDEEYAQLKKRDKQINPSLSLTPKTNLTLEEGDDGGIRVSIHYYCLCKHAADIKQKILLGLLDSLSGMPNIHLV